MIYFILGFLTGAITMFILIKKFIFDFDSSNCRKTCPEVNKKNGKGANNNGREDTSKHLA